MKWLLKAGIEVLAIGDWGQTARAPESSLAERNIHFGGPDIIHAVSF